LLRLHIKSDERTLKSGEPVGEVPVRRQDFPQFDEGARDVDAHFERTWTVENSGYHDRTVLGEGERQLAAAAAAGF
jgi:hypothetical protein